MEDVPGIHRKGQGPNQPHVDTTSQSRGPSGFEADFTAIYDESERARLKMQVLGGVRSDSV